MSGDAGDQCSLGHRRATILDRAQGSASGRRPSVRRVPDAALVSFRLGGRDGVSIESAKWAAALGLLGWRVRTVAGAGPVDTKLEGLAIDAPVAPSRREVDEALAPFDLVIVENLCSLPLNPAAAAVVAAACAGRPAILHHHDLAWQRPQLAHLPPPPDDPAWAHVTINDLSRRQLAARGMAATTIYNRFDPDPPAGDREGVRRALGVAAGTRLLLQPTRALARKNVAAGLALTAAVGGTYWLLGPAEDGYGPELDRLVEGAACPVLLGADGPDGAERTGRGGVDDRRCLRRLRCRPVAVDLGRLREPGARVGHPPPAPGHRAVPGGLRVGRLRLPVVRQRGARPPLGLAR